MEELGLPPNPDYGSGRFIRSLKIATRHPNSVLLALEDPHHAFHIRFQHDGEKITDIDAEWHRHPMSGCSGASAALKELCGYPLGGDLLETMRFVDGRQHCTHQFDMLCFGISHAWHQREDRRYDVIIPDAKEGHSTATLLVNGNPALELVLDRKATIIAPEKYQGVSFLRGFTAWARENLSALELEYALILQRGYFVSQSRQVDFSPTIGQPAVLSGPPIGVCFMAQPERYSESVRLDSIRELSDADTTQLLRFVDF